MVPIMSFTAKGFSSELGYILSCIYNLRQSKTIFHLSLTLMTLTLSKNILWHEPQFEFVWCLLIRVILWRFFRNITKVYYAVFLSFHLIKWNFFYPVVMMSTLIYWLRWCLPGFSTVNYSLFFSNLSIVFWGKLLSNDVYIFFLIKIPISSLFRHTLVSMDSWTPILFHSYLYLLWYSNFPRFD